MNENLKIIILTIFIFFIIFIFIIPIFIIFTEYKLYKYKLYVEISCFIFRKFNKTKIKMYKNKKLSNFTVINIKKEEPIKCEICYQEYDHETKDKYMCFSCCKYKNMMCEKCIIKYYKIKNKEFSLFSTVMCPFCTQKIYVCNFEPDIVLNISQHYIANTSTSNV